MTRPPRYHSGKKRGKLAKGRTFKALAIQQGKHTLYSFSEKAAELWSFVSISRREEDKDEGYQRVLSTSRVRAVADYILAGNIIPGSITIALDAGKFNKGDGTLHIDAGRDVAWVIDGQHRLAGAHLASEEGVNIELNVIALVDFGEQEQIEQFVTINREGKNVPTSLYLDLLKRLPHIKKPGEVASERAADIANELRHKKNSIFYGRISVTTSPRQGQQISMVNFVRKITPYVNPEHGLLNVFTLPQQIKIVENYFTGIKNVYPDEWRKSDCIFFKTVGFGALWNVFEAIFKECTLQGTGFGIQDVEEVLAPMRNFDFAQWSSIGSGSKAEIEAGKDFRIDFARSVEKRRTGGVKKQIRL